MLMSTQWTVMVQAYYAMLVSKYLCFLSEVLGSLSIFKGMKFL